MGRSRGSNKIISPGDRFGRLVAIEKTDEPQAVYPMWRCKCDCGRETNVRADCLFDGRTRSCGCSHFGANRHSKGVEIGQRFGRLVMIGYGENHRVVCRCDCGSTKAIFPANLRAGNTKSCGCLSGKPYTGPAPTIIDTAPVASPRKPASEKVLQRRKAMIGERYGMLTVIGVRLDGRLECKCDCGLNKTVSVGNLRNGTTKSCGCLLRSGKHEWLKKPRLGTDQSIRSDNTTGVRGVSRQGKKYIAIIVFKKKRHYLGLFDTLEEAAEARRRAEQTLLQNDKSPLT